jgi:EmrB/QacA subfamily drug resistance transporter
MLLPIGTTFVYRLAPPARVGAVMGIFGIPILLGPALGPILSGWLVQYADWRYVFLINLPVGILAVAMGVRFLPALEALGSVRALDTLGTILGPLAFASLSFGISQSTADTWTGTSTLAGLSLGGIALAAFIVRELTAEHPLLELRVFRSPDFSLAIVMQWILAAALFGSLFLVPLFLQQVRGYGALDTGLATLPQAIGAGIFIMIGGRLFDRVGARPTVFAGAILITAGLWLISQVSASTTGPDLIVPLFVWGAGLGLALIPLNTQILNSAPRALVSRVTSLTNALQSVVVSLAVATYATILQGRLTSQLAAVRTGAARFATDPIHSAMAAAYDDTFRVGMSLAAIAIVLALALRRTGGENREDQTQDETPELEEVPSVA